MKQAFVRLMLTVPVCFTLTTLGGSFAQGARRAEVRSVSITKAVPLRSYAFVGEQSAPEKPDQFAIIFFYRLKGWPPTFFEPVLLVDGGELARMDSGRYFAIRLEPGKHTFRTEHMKESLSLELEAGKEYYFEVRPLARRKSSLTAPDSALGKAITETPEKIRLKPLDAEKIIDSSKVIANYAESKKPSK